MSLEGSTLVFGVDKVPVQLHELCEFTYSR